MKTIAIVPIKRFAAAKQRLSSGMDTHRRSELVAAMLADVLEAISGSRSIDGTIVVTGEGEAGRIARAAGAEVLADSEQDGHSEAAVKGMESALAGGADAVALLPGDCPMLRARELERLLTGMPDPYLAIVPDRHGTGTNALVMRPPGVITPSFGEGSRDRHVGLAREAGVPYTIEELPSLALDLDTPADIVALTMALEMGRGSAPRTAKALGI